jgi:hypothetical protein
MHLECMAKRSSHRSKSLARVIRAPKPIVIRTTKVVKAKRHHSRRHHGGGMGSLFSKDRLETVGAGFAIGALEKMAFVQSLPSLPLIGKTGTLGLACVLIGGGRKGIVDDVATAAFTIAGYMMGSTGSIVGGEDGGVDTSGYVAGF